MPPRLHVLLARDSPVGIVFRRGPTNAVCSILWDRTRNCFQPGQWLRGRIYERRADLSPDGRYMIYFARGGKASPETGGSWTAVSRAPWLKALSLYAKGDSWQGGGLFTSNRSFWLNGCHTPLRQWPALRIDEKYRPPGRYGGECPGVYYCRLQRDGWNLVTHLSAGASAHAAVFEKIHASGWILRKLANADVIKAPGRGCYWDEHELQLGASGKLELLPSWEWAELDGDSLLWAEAGCIKTSALSAAGRGPETILFDSSPMEFERRIAPY